MHLVIKIEIRDKKLFQASSNHNLITFFPRNSQFTLRLEILLP
jgi:hypothetical protein